MTTSQPYIPKKVFTLITTEQLIKNRLICKDGNSIHILKFEQRIYKGKWKCFVDATYIKPHNHINISGSNEDGFVIVQNMDIRCSNWVIYIEIIIPIWIIESNEILLF